MLNVCMCSAVKKYFLISKLFLHICLIYVLQITKLVFYVSCAVCCSFTSFAPVYLPTWSPFPSFLCIYSLSSPSPLDISSHMAV